MSHPPRVLLAEDNPALLRITSLAIERGGFQVAGARNGREALAMLETQSCDLVITDQQMPYLSGLEFIVAMRQLPDHAATPVVLLTAKALELDAQQLAEELRVTHVLGKPFSPQQLSRVAQELVAAPA